MAENLSSLEKKIRPKFVKVVEELVGHTAFTSWKDIIRVVGKLHDLLERIYGVIVNSLIQIYYKEAVTHVRLYGVQQQCWYDTWR